MTFSTGTVFATAIACVALVACAGAEPAKPPGALLGRGITLVHLPGFQVDAEAERTGERLAEAVGYVTAQGVVNVALLGGDAFVNDVAHRGAASLDQALSVMSIVPSLVRVVPGKAELSGTLPRDQVLRTLRDRGVASGLQASFTDVIEEGVRLIVLEVSADGTTAPAATDLLEKTLKDTPDAYVIVAAYRLPKDARTVKVLVSEPRVKVVIVGLGRAEKAALPARGAVVVGTPDGSVRVVRLWVSRVRTGLATPPAHETRDAVEATVR